MYLTTDLLNKQIPKREGIEIIEIIEIIKRSVTANEGPMFDPQPSMLTTREVQQELRLVYLKKKSLADWPCSFRVFPFSSFL